MDFGDVIKINNSDYIVLVDLEVRGSGYNVVPKSIDPYNQYDIEAVRAYCLAHPDRVYDDYKPQQQEPSWEDRIEAQVIYTAMTVGTLIED